MKKILITGANSYLGTRFSEYMSQWPEQYQVDTLDLMDGGWREKSFLGYDCVYHVAGIAHIRETKENAHLYYEIDRDLAVEVAQKAKNDGVGQFVFPSSMSVYGLSVGVITADTKPMPRTNYGRAKLEAEQIIGKLRSDDFRVVVLRPPMVYGKNCKGNYQILVKLAKIVPVFPDYENWRSMLHVDGLCDFVKNMIDERADGLYFPQDPEYICTSKMVQQIARDMGRDVPLWKIFNPAVSFLARHTRLGRKGFGNLIYAMGEAYPVLQNQDGTVKRILITGAYSYIGTSFEKYVSKWPQRYLVDTADTKTEEWREIDFFQYDAVYHVAGIAHSDMGKVSEAQKAIYYRVNRDLAVEVARKAKAEGVRQFIFMSSSIVYGDSAPVGQQRLVDECTSVSPSNFYGDSKLQAEQGLLALSDDQFKVVILRPPMIYGPGCKGNYPILAKLARVLPVFPAVGNQRSMLYVENLMEFVRLMVENEEQGIFWPQNAEYSNTSELVSLIAKTHGKLVVALPKCDWILKFLGWITPLVNKAFGNFAYDMKMSEYKENYRVCSLEQSIILTEERNEFRN